MRVVGAEATSLNFPFDDFGGSSAGDAFESSEDFRSIPTSCELFVTLLFLCAFVSRLTVVVVEPPSGTSESNSVNLIFEKVVFVGMAIGTCVIGAAITSFDWEKLFVSGLIVDGRTIERTETVLVVAAELVVIGIVIAARGDDIEKSTRKQKHNVIN